MKQTMQDTMKAVAMDRFGGLETMETKERPVPDIDADEILIRVECAGVGVWDPYEREGGFAEMFGTKPRFPYVLGSDGAGIVVATGERVDDIKVGERVYALSLASPKGGFYAQYAAVKAEYAARVPDKLTTEQAGVMPVDAITAMRGLEDTLRLKPGETVMIFGASGGIGHLAVQFAKRMGCRVFAVASRDDGVELVKRLGADAVVDGHRADVPSAARAFAPQGIDAALVTAGGDAVNKGLTALREGGRVAYPNGVEPEPQAPQGVAAQSYDGTPDRRVIEKINQLIDAGPFDVHVARTFPLEHAADAHRALGEHYLGKLALSPQER